MNQQSELNSDFLLAGMLAGMLRGAIKERLADVINGAYDDVPVAAIGRILELFRAALTATETFGGTLEDLEAVIKILDAADELAAGEVVH